jgi:uncharacterized protein YdeI (YjbR/CyaY-like superfamily)
VEPIYFASPEEFRAWLEELHASESEVLVGYHRKGTGRPSMTWQQSVDEALCYGWIDGVRRGVDDERYSIRFTPRKATSTWSAVNIDRFQALEAEGRTRPAGHAAFAARREDRSRIYSYERREEARFEEDEERRFRENAAAWAFWQARPPGYRRVATHWVISAKKPETRGRRLAQLIEDSANGLLIKSQRRP